MFPHTNNSTANFCHKSVVQGGEKEIEEKLNIKYGIRNIKKSFVTSMVINISLSLSKKKSYTFLVNKVKNSCQNIKRKPLCPTHD